MAYSEQKLTPAKEKKRLEDFDKKFRAAVDHPTWVDWRKHAIECFKYKEGDQWTTAELSELKKRGQPPTVNNQISVTIERMVGQFVQQKTRIAYRGRNPQDQPLAEALSDTLLFVRQNNQLEFEERETADDGFTCGFGVLETDVSFDDAYQPEIKIRTVSPFEIFPDPFSRRYDWNDDATYICRAKWVDLEEAIALYPDKEKKLRGLVNDTETVSGGQANVSGIDAFTKENYVDFKLERIRLVECAYKTKKRESICLFEDGTIVDKEEMTLIEPRGQKQPVTDDQLKALKARLPYKEIDRIVASISVGIFACGVLLEHKESPLKRFKYIPYFVHRKKSGEPYSLIHISLSMQDSINKRGSKALHLINTNQSIYEQGAIVDKNEHANQKARPDGQMELARGYFEKFQLHNNIELAASQMEFAREDKQDFRRITGINPDALGEASQVRSGVGIARKQAMTGIIIAPIFDNFRRTRQLLAKNVVELIQVYFTETKLFYITDDLNKVKQIALQADHLAQIKQGIYDVVVEDLPDTTTMQEEQFQMLATILPQILPFGPFWTKKLIQISDIRNKEDIVKEIEQMTQPPPDKPKITLTLDWAKLVGPEKAAFANEMGLPQLAQFEMQNAAPPEHLIKAQTDIAKEQGKADIEQIKQQGEVIKQQGVMMKTKVDVAKAQMDMVNAREKHQMDLEKAAVSIAQAREKGAANGGQGNSA